MWGRYKKQEPFRFSNYFEVTFTIAAERFALPALGWGRLRRPARKMIRRRKLLEIAAESPASGARLVGWLCARLANRNPEPPP